MATPWATATKSSASESSATVKGRALAAQAEQGLGFRGLASGGRELNPEQAILRLKSLRAVVQAYQQELAATLAWRIQKLQEDDAVQREVEDEALDRYQQNIALLEELFRGDAGELAGLQDSLQGTAGQEGREEPGAAAPAPTALQAGLACRAAARQRHRSGALGEDLCQLEREGTSGSPPMQGAMIGWKGAAGGPSPWLQSSAAEKRKRASVAGEEGTPSRQRMAMFDSLLGKIGCIEKEEDMCDCVAEYEKAMGQSIQHILLPLSVRESDERPHKMGRKREKDRDASGSPATGAAREPPRAAPAEEEEVDEDSKPALPAGTVEGSAGEGQWQPENVGGLWRTPLLARHVHTLSQHMARDIKSIQQL